MKTCLLKRSVEEKHAHPRSESKNTFQIANKLSNQMQFTRKKTRHTAQQRHFRLLKKKFLKIRSTGQSLESERMRKFHLLKTGNTSA